MKNLEPRLLQLLLQPVGEFHNLYVAGIKVEEVDLVGGNRPGPDDPVVVVVLLDHRGYGAGDADAVTPHDHWVLLPLLVQVVAAHGEGVFRPQLEDLADLNAAKGLKMSLSATGAEVAFGGLAQVEEALEIGEVPAGKEPEVVEVGLVRPAGQVESPLQASIPIDGNLELHGADEAGFTPRQGLRLLQGNQFQGVRPQEIPELDLVGLMIASKDEAQVPGLPSLGGTVEVELAGMGQGKAVVAFILEGLGLLLHGDDPGGLEVGGPQGELSLVPMGVGKLRGFRLLDVAGVFAAVAAEDGVLTAPGQNMELMGEAPTDGSAVGLYGAELDSQPSEDPFVGFEHLPILPISAGVVYVKGVAVLHDELTPPHEAETGPNLIPELALDLEKVDRKLFIALDIPSHDVGDDLFMGRSKAEIGTLAVLEAEKLFTVERPTGALLPEFGRLDRRHQELLATIPLQLLPNDGLELLDTAVGQGEIVVDSGGQLLNHTGADHQLLADDVGVPRNLTKGLNQSLRLFHPFPLPGARSSTLRPKETP